jgi:hypothetical protein
MKRHKANLIISLNIHRPQGCKIGKDRKPIIKELEQFLCVGQRFGPWVLHHVKHSSMMKNMNEKVGGHVGEDEEIGSPIGEDKKPKDLIKFQILLLALPFLIRMIFLPQSFI